MLIVYMISVQLNETCSAAHTVLYNVENDLRTYSCQRCSFHCFCDILRKRQATCGKSRLHVHKLKVSRNSLDARTERCVRTHEDTLDEESAGFISELPRARKTTRHDCVHMSYTASYNLDGDQCPSAAL